MTRTLRGPFPSSWLGIDELPRSPQVQFPVSHKKKVSAEASSWNLQDAGQKLMLRNLRRVPLFITDKRRRRESHEVLSE